MKNNVTDINSAKPEQWLISVGMSGKNSISCFYFDEYLCWAGQIAVESLEKLPAALNKAKRVMRAAKRQHTRMEVTV